jgi:hypothetical protein
MAQAQELHLCRREKKHKSAAMAEGNGAPPRTPFQTEVAMKVKRFVSALLRVAESIDFGLVFNPYASLSRQDSRSN